MTTERTPFLHHSTIIAIKEDIDYFHGVARPKGLTLAEEDQVVAAMVAHIMNRLPTWDELLKIQASVLLNILDEEGI